MKPHIAIDCFFGELELEPQIKEISSMVKVVLGDECDHEYFSVVCVDLDETAAEKWVALTRRIARSIKEERDADKHLVRHLYDLYQLSSNNHLSDKYYLVIHKVLQKEQTMFKTNSHIVTTNEISYSKQALHDLHNNLRWHANWDYFLEQMVYQPNKPTFEQAMTVIEKLIPLG